MPEQDDRITRLTNRLLANEYVAGVDYSLKSWLGPEEWTVLLKDEYRFIDGNAKSANFKSVNEAERTLQMYVWPAK